MVRCGRMVGSGPLLGEREPHVCQLNKALFLGVQFVNGVMNDTQSFHLLNRNPPPFRFGICVAYLLCCCSHLKGLFSLIGCQQVKDLMRLALQEGLDAIVYLGVALRTLKP